MVSALGEIAPGPVRLRVPPPAAVIARLPYWKLHRFGVERRRAEVIITAARSAKRLEETAAMELPAAWARLQAFPGVGPWTAAKVALVALGDADAVPLGDYHLPHMVGFAFDGTARSTDERMLELLEPYRGHRSRVIRLLMLAGVARPAVRPSRRASATSPGPSSSRQPVPSSSSAWPTTSAMPSGSKIRRAPAAAYSSGSGRVAPSASDARYFRTASGPSRRLLLQTWSAASCASPYSM